MNIPFNRPHLTGKEWENIKKAYEMGQLAGDGLFTRRCEEWLETNIGCGRALLTHSCTAALEMAALLIGIVEGDEVIMPSFAFVSTANAFVMRGATPVFVDIRLDTLNIDEVKIEAAITEKTKAIVVVHYAGVSCNMQAINALAKRYNLHVIEDAAQGIMSTYRGSYLGSIGELATISFHETKNIISGEGGALLINAEQFEARAEILREKGTDRKQFLRDLVDKYTWVDIGSSYLPGELISAFLFAQMQEAIAITEKRISIWNKYHEAFRDLEERGVICRPTVPSNCQHNAHMYYIRFGSDNLRDIFIGMLEKEGISAVFHYVPLHSSPMGQHIGRVCGNMVNTDNASKRLVRMPLWVDMSELDVATVIDVTYTAIKSLEDKYMARSMVSTDSARPSSNG